MKSRDIYLNKLVNFKDKPLIKVITGIRRCGKSTLLDLFEEYLLNNGIKKENIIHMNFEDLLYDEIKDYKDLNKYIKEKILDNDKKYIILDEIQQISNWEKLLILFLLPLIVTYTLLVQMLIYYHLKYLHFYQDVMLK